MPRDYVFNELSLGDVEARPGDALSLMEGLETLLRIVGAPGVARMSVWHGIRARTSEGAPAPRCHLNTLRRISTRAPAAQRDKWRRLLRVFDTAEDFVDDLIEDEEVHYEGERAPGLGHALRLNGLALSLASADRWDSPWVSVMIARLEAVSAEMEEHAHRVRHASRTTHIGEHADWHPLDDAARLRVLLHSRRPVHKPASRYRGGKHVRGRTNEQRMQNASGPLGDGQYLAQRGGQPVTDEVIRGWEDQALEHVKSGLPCTVERRGNMYFVFCDIGQSVGYHTPTGEETSWLRVEWSSGEVHSHPRRP